MKIAIRAFIVFGITFVTFFCVKTWLTECNTLGAFLIAIIPSLFVVLADYVVFYSMLPELEVVKPTLHLKNISRERVNDIVNTYTIKVPVKNLGIYSVLQVEIEACILSLNENGITTYLKADFDRFLMIPGSIISTDNTRTFKFKERKTLRQGRFIIDDNTIDKLRDNNKSLRVRVYATHAISGLGRAYEYFFKLQGDVFRIEGVPNYDKLSLAIVLKQFLKS